MKWAEFQELCRVPMAPEWEQYFHSNIVQMNTHLSREITGFLFPSYEEDDGKDPAILIDDMCKVLPPQCIIVGDEEGEALMKRLNRYYQCNSWYQSSVFLLILAMPLTDRRTKPKE